MTDKVTIERATLEQAIDALECSLSDSRPYIVKSRESAAALRAALAAQPAEPVEPVASYWLIECKNGFTGWYTGQRLDCRFFDTDPRKAYKFASKELAENEISKRGNSCMTATEHVDIAAPPAPAAVPLTDDQIDHALAETLDALATAYGLSHAMYVRTDIGVHSRLRRAFARTIERAHGIGERP